MEEWDKWPDGNVIINSVLGWETATATETALIRIVYASTPQEAEAGKNLQIAMTLPQTEALIRDLTTTLEAARQHGRSSDG